MKKLYIILLLALTLSVNNSTYAQRTEVTFYTSMGDFKVDLWDSLTVVTVDSFLARVNRGFYDGLIFHRVIDNFMIQGGDPLGNGTGGTGTNIPDEFHPSLTNVPQALAMANTGQPNTGDCQFYINLVNNSHLNNKHTVFGMVTTGFNIVQNIGKVATGTNDKPVTDVTMDSIRVTRVPASIVALQDDDALSIYPNPTAGMFTVRHDRPIEQIQIYDQIMRRVYLSKPDAKQQLVNLQHLQAGVYLVVVSNKQQTHYKKLLIN